jgi:hypothetical protein
LKVHPACLEKEAPEEEDSDDEGERDDDNLDDSHRRLLLFVSAQTLFSADILKARRVRCQRSALPVKTIHVSAFPSKYA